MLAILVAFLSLAAAGAAGVTGAAGATGAARRAEVYAGASSAGQLPSAPVLAQPGFADGVFVRGLVAPMSMTFAFDMIYVCEKNGPIVIVVGAGVGAGVGGGTGTLLPTPFLVLAPSLGQDSQGRVGDGGVFSLAFDPSDARGAFVYVQWLHPGQNGPGLPWVGDFSRVSRFAVSADHTVADRASEVIVFDHSVLRPGTVFHLGGSLVFGTDGMLYSSHGDYYSYYSQKLDNSLGKVSRFAKDGTIPSDNPFLNFSTNAGRAAYVIGLRNPFVISASPIAGQLQIYDVGEDLYEEVNLAAAGANGGWPSIEGYGAAAQLPLGSAGTYMDPFFAYDHQAQPGLAPGLPSACSVTGGALYGGASFPTRWLGGLFFSDLCGGWIAWLPSGGAPLATGQRPVPILLASGFNTPHSPTVSPYDGSLFIFSHDDGAIHRISFAPTSPPTITEQPASASAPLGEQVVFSVSVASAAAVSYRWQRAAPFSASFVDLVDGAGAGVGALTSRFVTAPVTLADNRALYRVAVHTSLGGLTSAAAALGVTNNLPPSAAIVWPPSLALAGLRYSNFSVGSYSAGDTFTFAGVGVDNSGPAPVPATLTYNVYLRHLAHRHDFAQGVPGPNLTITVPRADELSPVQAFQVDLVATDRLGATAIASAFVYPILGRLTLQTDPPGGAALLNGQPVTTPASLTTVAGVTVQVSPMGATGESAGNAAAFVAWADDASAPATRSFVVPPADSSLTLLLSAPSASAAPPAPAASAAPPPSPSSSASPDSPFAARGALTPGASSGAAGAAKGLSLAAFMARLAFALLVGEAVRRLA